MLKRISLFALIALVIASCSSEEEKSEPRELHEYVSASMKDNKEIIAFGSVGVKGILDKTDYQSEDMLKGLIGEELKKLNSVLNMDSPVYFYVEGPLAKDGSPKRTVLFMKVKNADALAKDLEEERSFLVEKTGDIRYAEDNEFVIGFRDDLAIAIVQPGDYDAASLMKKAFKKTQGDLSGGKTDKMLKSKGDIVVSMNMESMYGTSNTSLSQLSAAKQKKLKQMSKGSFIQMKMNFNKGSLVLESKNYFSKDLQDVMFFSSSSSNDMKNSLAKGNPDANVIGGFSGNIDVKKVEKFYQTFAPDMMEEMKKNMDEMGPVLQFIGAGNIMSSLITGEFGALFIEDDGSNDISIGTKMFLGTTEAGQKSFMMMKSEMDMPEDIDFQYVEGGLELYDPAAGGSASSMKGDSKLKMPKSGNGFGQKGIYGFFDFKQISTDEMAMQQKMIFDMFDYATIEGGNDGMKLELHMTNKKDNILKQMTQLGMSMMPMLMGGGMPF